MIKLVRAELLKVRSTNIWWIFVILLVVMVGLSFLVNAAVVDSRLTGSATPSLVNDQAASLYTSGQYFGLVFVLVLGILVVTNEFFHQTATATFLTVPRRTVVIVAKLAAAVLIGALYWLLATVLGVAAGAIFLNTEGYGPRLDAGSVWRSILLNLLGYAVWAIVGVGLGSLIRAQIASVIVGIVAYFVTGTVAQLTAQILSQTSLHWTWATKVVMVLPATASQLMIQGNAELDDWLPQWAGAAILIGWGVVAGVIGTALTRTRDIT